MCNLRTQIPETESFDVGMHIDALVAHGVQVDIVLCDTSAIPLGHTLYSDGRQATGPPQRTGHDPAKLASALSDLLG